jgi:hypothetical protein
MFSSLGVVINAMSILLLYILVAYLISEVIHIKQRMETNRIQMRNLIKDINHNDSVLHTLLKEDD